MALIIVDSTNQVKMLPQLFDFADKYRGSYSGSCPFYCSFSGYQVITGDVQKFKLGISFIDHFCLILCFLMNYILGWTIMGCILAIQSKWRCQVLELCHCQQRVEPRRYRVQLGYQTCWSSDITSPGKITIRNALLILIFFALILKLKEIKFLPLTHPIIFKGILRREDGLSPV